MLQGGHERLTDRQTDRQTDRRTDRVNPIYPSTFTHARADAGGGGRKIGFNTNHYMRSHMRGRGAEAEREEKPLRKKWVQHPIKATFTHARSGCGAEAVNWVLDPFLAERFLLPLRLRSATAHVWTHVMCWSQFSARPRPQPLRACVNEALPRPLRNRALQTIIVLKKWQIRPRPLRVCVNIPAVAEREYQNPPASAPQPHRACVNVA